MSWFMTADPGRFLAAAGEFLRADPAANTVMLTVTENLRVSAAAPAAGQPLYGWLRPASDPAAPAGDPAAPAAAPAGDPAGDSVGAAFMHTPDFPLMLSRVSGADAARLARDLAEAGHRVGAVNAGQEAAEAFAAAWRERTRVSVAVYRRMRLFRLGELLPPRPAPEGTARLATGSDQDLLAGWFGAFVREVGDAPGGDQRAAVAERLGYGGITVWQAGGVPVSVAGRTRVVAGMVRIGPVYTPPELRGHGYAAAATAAVSQVVLDAGVRDVVLYTDLANPTSNALYQRLGYRPVEDRVVLSFTPAHHALRFTRERTPGLCPAGRR
jgi:RimJ/RimL family protein N-acetyltransferase